MTSDRGPGVPVDGRPTGTQDRSGDGARRIVASATLCTGTLATATGAGLGARLLVSPPTLATGIVQASALVVLVLGVLLLLLGSALRTGPTDEDEQVRAARRRRSRVGAGLIVVAVGAAVAVGLAG